MIVSGPVCNPCIPQLISQVQSPDFQFMNSSACPCRMQVYSPNLCSFPVWDPFWKDFTSIAQGTLCLSQWCQWPVELMVTVQQYTVQTGHCTGATSTRVPFAVSLWLGAGQTTWAAKEQERTHQRKGKQEKLRGKIRILTYSDIF